MMRSLFENATEGIVVANAAGNIMMMNPCAEKLFGYESEELMGKSVDLLLPDSMRAHHHQHRDNFVAKPVNRAMGHGRDLHARKKDGSVFPVEISLSHFDIEGELFVIAFVIDISVRKQIEAEREAQKKALEEVSAQIKLQNTELEQKIIDRTTMLRETLVQLEQSKEELEISLQKEKELSDLKSRFVSTVSHEFRTPLSTVLSSASLLARYNEEADGTKRQRHIDRIKDSVRHLNGLMEDLLSLGRIDEGLIELHPEPFQLRVFLEELLSEMREIALPTQQLLLQVSGSEQSVLDKRLLRNILLNLISNAIKFSSENGTIEVIAGQGEKLTISVKDAGIGISEEDQQHLFERFFRAKNAINIQGTGLGLHIVSKYIELLNGSIHLTSALGKGTTITIII